MKTLALHSTWISLISVLGYWDNYLTITLVQFICPYPNKDLDKIISDLISKVIFNLEIYSVNYSLSYKLITLYHKRYSKFY